jgi:hypothetical protein
VNPILYQLDGNLLDGQYLPGEYQWSTPVVLASAACAVRTLPTLGVLVLTLELGGVLTPLTFTVTSAGVLPPGQSLNVTVPANTLVRWKASFSGPPATSADGVAVVVTPAAPSPVAPVLTVQWLNGPENLTLFSYAAGGSFTPLNPALLAGRATITQTNSQTSFFIQGVECLRVANGIFYANDFDVEGAQTVETPKLQFQLNGVTLATLTRTGLHLPDADELPPLSLGAGEFDFYNNGTLAAVLWPRGLIAAALREGLP